MTTTSVLSRRYQCVRSDCPTSLGRSSEKRSSEGRSRFLGPGDDQSEWVQVGELIIKQR